MISTKAVKCYKLRSIRLKHTFMTMITSHRLKMVAFVAIPIRRYRTIQYILHSQSV